VFKCVRKPTKRRLSLTHHAMQTNPAAEPNENIAWSESQWNQFGMWKGNGL